MANPFGPKWGFHRRRCPPGLPLIERPPLPVSRLVNVENTTNMGGGVAWPAEALDSVFTTAKELGLKTHMDGSRLFNAVVETGLSAERNRVTILIRLPSAFRRGWAVPRAQSWVSTKRISTHPSAETADGRGHAPEWHFGRRRSLRALRIISERLKEDHENATRLAQGLAQGIPI